MSCEIKFAHAHVRARSHVCDVRAKRLSKCACDVRACGHFSCVRRAIAILHVFRTFWTFLAGKTTFYAVPWSYFIWLCLNWNLVHKKVHKKCKICFKISLLVYTCECVCKSNFGKTHMCVRCACGRTLSVRMCVRARPKIVATHSLVKVQILWECHKIWKNLPPFL